MTWIGTFRETSSWRCMSVSLPLPAAAECAENEHTVTFRILEWLQTDRSDLKMMATCCFHRYSSNKNRDLTPAPRPRQGQHIIQRELADSIVLQKRYTSRAKVHTEVRVAVHVALLGRGGNTQCRHSRHRLAARQIISCFNIDAN